MTMRTTEPGMAQIAGQQGPRIIDFELEYYLENIARALRRKDLVTVSRIESMIESGPRPPSRDVSREIIGRSNAVDPEHEYHVRLVLSRLRQKGRVFIKALGYDL